MEHKRKCKELTQEIYELLTLRPETRNSDKILWVAMLQNRGMDNQPIYRVMFDENAPKFESVSRIRRKLQKAYPELQAEDEVVENRMIAEEFWHSYGNSKGVMK